MARGVRLCGATVRRWLYRDSLRPIAEIDASGVLVARFVDGDGASNYLVKGGVTYRVVSDHLGSPRLLVDVATGAWDEPPWLWWLTWLPALAAVGAELVQRRRDDTPIAP